LAILFAFGTYMIEMFVMAFTTEYSALNSYSIMQVCIIIVNHYFKEIFNIILFVF